MQYPGSSPLNPCFIRSRLSSPLPLPPQKQHSHILRFLAHIPPYVVLLEFLPTAILNSIIWHTLPHVLIGWHFYSPQLKIPPMVGMMFLCFIPTLLEFFRIETKFIYDRDRNLICFEIQLIPTNVFIQHKHRKQGAALVHCVNRCAVVKEAWVLISTRDIFENFY